MTALELDSNRCIATTIAQQGGWLWVSLAPVEGWRWRLDGVEVNLEQGPGIIQCVEIPAGPHRLEGRYRPPALLPAALVSATAVLMAFFLVGYEWRGHSSIETISELARSRRLSAGCLRR